MSWDSFTKSLGDYQKARDEFNKVKEDWRNLKITRNEVLKELEIVLGEKYESVADKAWTGELKKADNVLNTVLENIDGLLEQIDPLVEQLRLAKNDAALKALKTLRDQIWKNLTHFAEGSVKWNGWIMAPKVLKKRIGFRPTREIDDVAKLVVANQVQLATFVERQPFYLVKLRYFGEDVEPYQRQLARPSELIAHQLSRLARHPIE